MYNILVRKSIPPPIRSSSQRLDEAEGEPNLDS